MLERALDQYKEEIRLLVAQQEEVYQQDRREDARIKLIEQDNVSRTIERAAQGTGADPSPGRGAGAARWQRSDG